MPIEATKELDTGVEVPKVDEMTREQLEHVVKSTPEELAEELATPTEEEVPEGDTASQLPEKTTPVLKGKAKPQAKSSVDEAIDIDLGNGRKISFKSKDELLQNYAALRKGLDELNGKHGKTVQELLRLQGLEQQFSLMQKELDGLKQSPTQPPKSQPVSVTADMVQKADEAGLDPDKFFADLTPENFASKMVQLRRAAVLEAKKEMEPTLQEIREENKKIRDEFGAIRTDMTYREQKSIFDSHYLNLMNEIGQLQAKVPAIKTQWTPEQINAAIQQYGPDQAQLVVPPGDFDKWTIIESMLKETYCPVDSKGQLDITQRKLKSINGAWAAFQIDHPELNDQTVAAAHTQGQQQVLEQVKRVTEKPPTLPNNLSTADTNPDAMTIEQAQKWISTPAETLAIWKRTKDPRYQKFEEAQEFAAKYSGI
jgi:hypothetical protein